MACRHTWYVTLCKPLWCKPGGLRIRLELLKSTHRWMARRAWSRWSRSFLLVGAIRALEVQWPWLECGSGKIFRQVAWCWWHFLGRIWGVLGGKCCLQQFPCCYCFTDVADCRCRWISSCLRRMLASRPKRHVQQMPFPLTSLISSAWASPRAACLAFRVRLYKSCVATSYHPGCSYEIHAKNPNPPDAPVRRTWVFCLDLSSFGLLTDTVYPLQGFLATFCWKPPMIWSDDTPLIARQWSQVARGLQGGMLPFDRLLQCYAPRHVRTRMEVVDKQTIGTVPIPCSLIKCIFVISCLRSGNGNSLHSLAGWALCKIRPSARWRQAHCCTEKNGTFVPTRLKWHFANLLIRLVKSKMCTSGFISIFLPTSLPRPLSLSLPRNFCIDSWYVVAWSCQS